MSAESDFAAFADGSDVSPDDERLHALIDVFLQVCNALEIHEPTDPDGVAVANAVIARAHEGAWSPVRLFEAVMRHFVPVQ